MRNKGEFGLISKTDIHRFYCSLSERDWASQPEDMLIYTEDDILVLCGDEGLEPVSSEDVKVTADYLRSLLKEQYGYDLQAKIKKIGFELGDGVRPYFVVFDRWSPPKPPEIKYEIVTKKTGSDYEQHTQFKTLKGLMDAFQIYQKLGNYHITAYENDVVIQTYIPKENTP